jgi:eukaryotic-like serine/threonine-protein kinase
LHKGYTTNILVPKMLKKSILANILLMLGITAGILFIFFRSLNTITKHGQEAKVPNVTGHQLKLALKELDGFELHIDSIYIPYKDPLEIIYQEPAAGEVVKKGRIIFLSVNKVSPPSISMPKLVDLSFRNAVLTLQSYRLVMGDTIFKPDLAAGAVLSQLYNGKEVSAGTQIPIGSRISLVVGAGLSDSAIAVPDLIGKTFAEARSIITGLGIEPNFVWDGMITDSLNAIVYEQFPESKNELDYINYSNPGELMDVRIMQKPSEELLRMHRAGSQRYLDPNDTSVKVIYGPPPSADDTAAALNELGAEKRKPKPKPKLENVDEEINSIINNDANAKPASDGNTDVVKPRDKPSTETKPSDKGASTTKPTDKAGNTNINTPVKPKPVAPKVDANAKQAGNKATGTAPKPDAAKQTADPNSKKNTPAKPKKAPVKESNKFSNENEFN